MLPLWYAYAIFGVFLFNSLLGYFINYRQIVLNTDQKGYKVTRVTTGMNVALKIIQILMLPLVPNPFLFYVGTSLFSTIFTCWWLNHTISKEYPWLKTKGYDGSKLYKSYPDIIKKINELEIATKNNTGLTVNFCLSYGGRNEIINATKKIAKKVKEIVKKLYFLL